MRDQEGWYGLDLSCASSLISDAPEVQEPARGVCDSQIEVGLVTLVLRRRRDAVASVLPLGEHDGARIVPRTG